MEFRLGSEQRVCGQGDCRGDSGRYGARMVVPRRHEVIDSSAPPRDDFLLGGKPPHITRARRGPVYDGGVAPSPRCAPLIHALTVEPPTYTEEGARGGMSEPGGKDTICSFA
jgi:hypothetical protein